MAMEMEDDFSSGSELSSDEELQVEFLKGNLKPGLIIRQAPLKVYTNNVAGMQEKLAELKQSQLKWIERMDVVVTADAAPVITAEEEEEGERRTDPEDDFRREMHFYQQAQSSVLIGLRKLEKLSVPTQRPDDYYAEMIKTDDHMRKVRQNLLSRQKMLEQKEKARKMRELKKYGKKVQQEILQKRREEKKATLQAVKKYSSKRGRGERPSFLGLETEGELPVAVEGVSAGRQGAGAGRRRAGGKVGEKSVKRMGKDKKFGFGGKKRWSKSNTAESSADMSAFNPGKHSRKTGQVMGGKGKGNSGAQGRGRGRRGKQDAGKKGKTVRLGKSRRQKNKMKLKRH